MPKKLWDSRRIEAEVQKIRDRITDLQDHVAQDDIVFLNASNLYDVTTRHDETFGLNVSVGLKGTRPTTSTG